MSIYDSYHAVLIDIIPENPTTKVSGNGRQIKRLVMQLTQAYCRIVSRTLAPSYSKTRPTKIFPSPAPKVIRCISFGNSQKRLEMAWVFIAGLKKCHNCVTISFHNIVEIKNPACSNS